MTYPTGPSLAVIIPTLNEAAYLEITLNSLAAQSLPAQRVLIVDGGSQDETVVFAQALQTEVLRVSHRGRGGQIAAGVAATTEDIIVIGHADMRFPRVALEAIRRRLFDEPRCPGGCLGHRFDSPRLIYRAIEWLDRRRARHGASYGDQAQFYRRDALARAGGFPEQPIMEDVELARRLRTLGPTAYLDVPVTVSPRHFERLGWWRVAWANRTFRRTYRRHGLAACQEIYDRYYASVAKSK